MTLQIGETVIQAYERMAAEVEVIVAQYPAEMRDELRSHAQEVIHRQLQQLWEQQDRQRRRATLS